MSYQALLSALGARAVTEPAQEPEPDDHGPGRPALPAAPVTPARATTPPARETRISYRLVSGGALVVEGSGPERFYPLVGSIVRALADEDLQAWRERELALLAASRTSELVEFDGRLSQAAEFLVRVFGAHSRRNYEDAVAFKALLGSLPRVGPSPSTRVRGALEAVAEWLGSRRVVAADVLALGGGLVGRADLVVEERDGLMAVVATLSGAASRAAIANAAVARAGGVVLHERLEPVRAVVLSVNGSLETREVSRGHADRLVSLLSGLSGVRDLSSVFGGSDV